MKSFHAGDYVSQGWGQSFPTAKTLIDSLVGKGILSEITGGRRGKKYVLSKYINIFVR